MKNEGHSHTQRERHTVLCTQSHYIKCYAPLKMILMMCNLLFCRWDRETHATCMRARDTHSSAILQCFLLFPVVLTSTRFSICSSFWKIGWKCYFNFSIKCVVTVAICCQCVIYNELDTKKKKKTDTVIIIIWVKCMSFQQQQQR